MASTALLVWFLVYLAIIFGVGLYAYRKVEDLDDYYLAGRNVPWWLLAGTYFATITSGGTFIGMSGVNYLFGYAPTVLWTAALLGSVVGVYFIGTKLRLFGQYTLPDYFGDRYDSDVIRMYTSALVIMMYLVWVGSGVISGGIIFQQLLGWEYWMGAVFITVVFVGYVYFGGVLAVVWTDFLQAVTFSIGSVIAVFFALQAVGGFGAFVDQMMATDPGWFTYSHNGDFPTTNWLLIWSLGLMAKPAAITRMYTAKSQKDISKSIIAVVLVGFVTVMSVTFISGVVRVMGPELASPENAFVWGAQNLMPDVIGAWLLAGILAAMISSADTQIMVMVMSIGRDFYQKVYNTDATNEDVHQLSRYLVVVVGAAVLVFGLVRPGLISFMQAFAISIIGGAFVPSLLLGMYWRGATFEGALSSMVLATLAAILLNGGIVSVPLLPPMAYVVILGFVTCFGVSYVTEISDKQNDVFEETLFARVRDSEPAAEPADD